MSFNKLFNTSLILLFVAMCISVAHADNITTKQIKDMTANGSSHLSADGKIRYSDHYALSPDGKSVTHSVKKSYLPATTDGKIIDHTKTAKWQIATKAKGIARFLGRNLNYIGWATLAVDLLGEGVDYVMDPANNSIQYSKPDLECKTTSWGNFTANGYDEFVSKMKSIEGQFFTGVGEYSLKDNLIYRKHQLGYTTHVGTCTQKQQETEVMTAEQLGDAIKRLAENGNENAKQVIIDTAKDEIINGEHDAELEKLANELNSDDAQDDTKDDTKDDTSTNTNTNTAIKPDTETDTDTKTDTKTDSDGGFELPAFCDWASVVCDFVEWVKTDDNDKDTQIDIEEPDIPTIDTNIKFNGQCPADMVLNFNLFGNSMSWTLFEWSKFCELLAMLKPIIIAMASFGAFKIVGGVNVSN